LKTCKEERLMPNSFDSVILPQLPGFIFGVIAGLALSTIIKNIEDNDLV
jgi:hypothetical protein